MPLASWTKAQSVLGAKISYLWPRASGREEEASSAWIGWNEQSSLWVLKIVQRKGEAISWQADREKKFQAGANGFKVFQLTVEAISGKIEVKVVWSVHD